MIEISLVVNHNEDNDNNHEDDDDEYDSYSTLIGTLEDSTFTIPKSNDKHFISTFQVRQTKFLF